MNGLKTGLGITPGEHIISADSALSRNIRHCFCLSCRGRLILQTDAQGAWFEHDLHALTAQQKTDCVVLNPEKSHPYIDDMAMFLSPLPVVLEWHCVMCGQHFPGKKFCEACGTGFIPERYVQSMFTATSQTCSGLWKCEHLIRNARSAQGVQSNSTNIFQC